MITKESKEHREFSINHSNSRAKGTTRAIPVAFVVVSDSLFAFVGFGDILPEAFCFVAPSIFKHKYDTR